MEYTLTIRQLAIHQNFPTLDIKDAAILDYMSRFACSPSIKKKIHAGQVYYWFAYQKIAEENPLVGLSPESLRKRLREFCRFGILQAHPDNQGGAVFFAFGERYELTHRANLPEVENANIGQNRPKGRANLPEVSPELRANLPDNQEYHFNQNNQNIITKAKNEFSPDTDDALAVYSVEIHEPVKVETIALPQSPKKETTSNGARRDDLGEELAEFMAKQYGVEVVTVKTAEQVPETLGKPRKTRQIGAPQPFPETAAAFAHFSNPDKIAAVWKRWLEYKLAQHRERYRTGDSELIQLRKVWKLANGDSDAAEQIIEQSVGNLWKGLFALKIENLNQNGKIQSAHEAKREQTRRELVEYYAGRAMGTVEKGWSI